MAISIKRLKPQDWDNYLSETELKMMFDALKEEKRGETVSLREMRQSLGL